VQRFDYDLEQRPWDIKRELEAETYRWGGYRAFWIYDPKQRLIRAAPFRDRVVHHALCRVLAPIVERGYIADTCACLAGRGTLAAVRRYAAHQCPREIELVDVDDYREDQAQGSGSGLWLKACHGARLAPGRQPESPRTSGPALTPRIAFSNMDETGGRHWRR
jgi:hypothetical protein